MKNVLKNYIQNISKEDIISFSKKNNTFLTEYELNYIYQNLKSNFDYIYNNKISFLNDLKNNLSPKNYTIIKEYYNKYSRYL